MKLETTWNEHGKIWHYFTTSREAKAARVEGVVLNPARGVWRSIAAYAQFCLIIRLKKPSDIETHPEYNFAVDTERASIPDQIKAPCDLTTECHL